MVAQQIGAVMGEVISTGSTTPTIILEPMAKNTAPAIVAACCAAMKQDKDAVVIVLPSDHVIADVEIFQNAIKTATINAEKGYLVDLIILLLKTAMMHCLLQRKAKFKM